MIGKGDVENGGRGESTTPLLENPQLRWSFIRKVYTIITFQFLLTIAIASVPIFIHPITHFFVSSTQDLVLYILLNFVPIIISSPLKYYQHKYPLNYFLLFIFTLSLAFTNCFGCAFESQKVNLEVFTLASVVVLSLTLYTFWTARRGHDFNFLGPFLFGAFVVLTIFPLIQILFPMGELSPMIYGCLGSIIFCGYIIYDTDNLIKKFSYNDEYIQASALLYINIIILFTFILIVFSATN